MGICINSLTVFIIFIFWPKILSIATFKTFDRARSTSEVEIEEKGKWKDFSEKFFPGIIHIRHLNKHTRFLLIYYFFVSGSYWFVCVTITQWISDKFQADYPDLITNSPMQPIDIGVAWGSISLAIFYTLWGIGFVIVEPFEKYLVPWSNFIRVVCCGFGSLMYALCYYYYYRSLRIMVLCLGLLGISYDWVFIYKMEDLILQDEYIQKEQSTFQQKEMVHKIIQIVTFLSEITFYQIVPVVIY